MFIFKLHTTDGMCKVLLTSFMNHLPNLTFVFGFNDSWHRCRHGAVCGLFLSWGEDLSFFFMGEDLNENYIILSLEDFLEKNKEIAADGPMP